MNKYPRKTLLANTFGMFGYVSCLILWAWTGILYVPMLLANKQIENLILPTPSETPVTPSASAPMSPIMVFFAVAVTAVVIILTIVVLLRAPITIAKTGKTVTTKAADSVIPLVAHGRPLPPVEKRRLTARLIKLAKLVLVILPVGLVSIGAFLQLPLPYELAMFASSVLALITVFWFSAQYILARAFGIHAQYLV